MTQAAAQLLHGQVAHVRLRPAPHRFVYPLFYVRLNLARLDECDTRWFGVERWRPLSIWRRDYGPRDGSKAFRLWLKHVPFFSKPAAPSHQTTVHQEPAR